MLKRLCINQLLFISHLALVVILIAGFSYARYQSEWKSRIHHEVELAQASLSPFMREISAAVAGRNYATLLMPSLLETLKNRETLLYLDIQGRSDYTAYPVGVRYLRAQNVIWRTDVTTEEIDSLIQRQRQLQASLSQAGDDPIKQKKLHFLLNKAKGELDALNNGVSLTESVSLPWQLPLGGEKYHLLADDCVLVVQLPMQNKNGGIVTAVFDADALFALKGEIYVTILVEASVALLASLLLILAVTRWLVTPLSTLAKRVDGDIDNLDFSDLDELSRHDEIGVLARGLHTLTQKTQSQLKLLRHLSDTDALTGLSGRQNYTRRAEAFMHSARIAGDNFGLIVCDIDQFKRYNDSYGHALGDEVIKRIATVLRQTTRKDDLCFRIGGEEFVALVHLDSGEDLRQMTERLRADVAALGIAHVTEQGVVTISIGAVLIEPGSSQTRYVDLFDLADKQLYQAKNRGRNQVAIATVSPLAAVIERESKQHASQTVD